MTSPGAVAITGASGLVGAALAGSLSADGVRVVRLVRREPGPGADEVRWSPSEGFVDAEALEGVDAVVHLAGESLASGRWTEARKALIRDSRVEGTRTLVDAITRMRRKPRVLVSASAIGYYGAHRGETLLTEGSPPGDDFLARVCVTWEAAAAPAREAGVRTVLLRTGLVLSAKGGALAKMRTPFKLGAGGVIGPGDQWVSWIALGDLVRIIRFALDREGLAGPINAVAPTPVTNQAFTKALGRALGRPTLIPLPRAPVNR